MERSLGTLCPPDPKRSEETELYLVLHMHRGRISFLRNFMKNCRETTYWIFLLEFRETLYPM